MVKVVQNDKLVYKVYIWVVFGIIFGKEKEDLKEIGYAQPIIFNSYHTI